MAGSGFQAFNSGWCPLPLITEALHVMCQLRWSRPPRQDVPLQTLNGSKQSDGHRLFEIARTLTFSACHWPKTAASNASRLALLLRPYRAWVAMER